MTLDQLTVGQSGVITKVGGAGLETLVRGACLELFA